MHNPFVRKIAFVVCPWGWHWDRLAIEIDVRKAIGERFTIEGDILMDAKKRKGTKEVFIDFRTP